MKYIRQLHKVKPSGFTRTIDNKQVDLYLSVFGIFDTEKVHWSYYYCSCYDSGNHTYMTNAPAASQGRHRGFADPPPQSARYLTSIIFLVSTKSSALRR